MKLTRLNDLLEDDKTVKGKWGLTPNHDLQYTSQGLDEELKINGTLLGAEADGLLFSVTERQKNQKIVTSLHRLTGVWKTNSKNQLVFEAEKESGKNDVLIFKSGWTLNEDHEIVYSWRRQNLKTKKTINQELVLRGVWILSEPKALIYSLGGDKDANLRFRGAFQTKSILAKKNEIRYQLGTEISGKRKIQTVLFFGKWKVSRDLELHFEIASRRKQVLTFGGEYALRGSRQIAVDLRSEKGKPLGVELILTQDIFGNDGQGFVRLQRTLEESSLEAGVKFQW